MHEYIAEPAVLPGHPVSGTIIPLVMLCSASTVQEQDNQHYKTVSLIRTAFQANRTPSLIRTALLLNMSYQPLVREDEEEE